ncbi:hypothetical protein ACIQAL_09960 [Pseudomonas sp. NPDC088368]|jgi:hypothetical protein|uniref:hypothetical protein n=1 Tax=Pseudomonas sp. NPDC088368 TaxID=3364453 RepID=UPI00380E6D6B
MLFLSGLFLTLTSWYPLNHKIRQQQQRKYFGLALIMAGASATFMLDSQVDDFFIWGFVVAWCIGLELFFNCDKYRDYYGQS